MAGTAAWSTVQLAEFLEVFEVLDREQMEQLAVDRIAESLDAEVVVVLLDGGIRRSLGFAADEVPERAIGDVARRRRDRIPLEGLGDLHSLSTPIGGRSGHLVVLRIDGEFDREEETLLRSMGRALGLALTAAASLESSRTLARQLGERQELSSRLFRIQQSISHRAPLQQVLDAITQGAAELLRAEVAGLRIASLDRDDPPHASLVGYHSSLVSEFARLPLDSGFAGQAMALDRLVVTDDYGNEPNRLGRNERYGLAAAMAAPVRRNGEPFGVLNVATSEAGRVFTRAEQEILLGLAEHASLAVNDASAVHELRRSLDGATHQSRHDALTGLPNRVAAVEALDRALVGVSAESQVAVLFIDLDRFKPLNDLFGHAFGDAVLEQVAARLRDTVRDEDTVARLAGDEFVVVSPAIDATGAAELGARLARGVSRPMTVADRVIELTASVGVAVAASSCSGEDLLSDADVAMYRAKQQGRSAVVRFDRAMRRELHQRGNLERELAIAVRGGQIVAHYQPVVDTSSGEVVSVEALARWEHPERGLLQPSSFIELAEDTGQIEQIDRLVLAQVAAQLASWQQHRPGFSASVNLAARQFSDHGIEAVVRSLIHQHSLEPRLLWLEITERVVMDHDSVTLEVLRSLQSMGIRLMLDDFGTGFSSLAYLKRYPVDAVKVDRSFVEGLGAHQEDEAIVTAILTLAEALGHEVVAEGAERPEQVDWLREKGCNLVQGFLFSPPVPAPAITEMLTAARPLVVR